MGVQDQFAPTPAHGAAYRVILERTELAIASMKTAEDLSAVEGTINSIVKWSESQGDGKILQAYSWAAGRVRQTARDRFAIILNSKRVSEAYSALPKPPEKEKSP
jgi:hypothetical protein